MKEDEYVYVVEEWEVQPVAFRTLEKAQAYAAARMGLGSVPWEADVNFDVHVWHYYGDWYIYQLKVV